jgi:hypothetical protein
LPTHQALRRPVDPAAGWQTDVVPREYEPPTPQILQWVARQERAAGVRVDRRADLRALLCFDLGWQRFIPRQVAGRAQLDVAGRPDRVAAAIRGALDGIG